ncbi:MAG: class I SAM-dependent methyltransferase [Methanobrevibacter sp.]|uniref:class I SAM-dependent methyltransferase n=1 Tax=Methanobrevibacter sp. TaxID=66852 RepID=UPI0026E09026|nr:class I SAM-dependent methyltransferase [Methanobrevibacter sp.]MDO5848739.1 class I SAM-dependent methyltransferase [Methanobrevibacter sp.]
MKKQCIDNPDELDWVAYWQKAISSKEGKDWDKAAVNFKKRNRKDDYQNSLFSKLPLTEDDTVLDVGCGEGSITLPIAKKVKRVTSVDSSRKMLELLNERVEDEGVDNVDTILKPIEDIRYDEIGDHDIVIASRSMNGIVPIEETISELNKIANKYVFITVFGPNDRKMIKDFEASIGKDSNHFPDYNYLFNILFNMGIYANVERLDIKEYPKYDSIEEAMNNGKFRLDLLDDSEKDELKTYLEKVLKKDPKTGKLYNKNDNADWMLFWWKKEDD